MGGGGESSVGVGAVCEVGGGGGSGVVCCGVEEQVLYPSQVSHINYNLDKSAICMSSVDQPYSVSRSLSMLHFCRLSSAGTGLLLRAVCCCLTSSVATSNSSCSTAPLVFCSFGPRAAAMASPSSTPSHRLSRTTGKPPGETHTDTQCRGGAGSEPVSDVQDFCIRLMFSCSHNSHQTSTRPEGSVLQRSGFWSLAYSHCIMQQPLQQLDAANECSTEARSSSSSCTTGSHVQKAAV